MTMRATGAARHALLIATMSLVLAGCGAWEERGADPVSGCDDSIERYFHATSDTRVVLVRQFNAGQQLALAGDSMESAPVTPADVCLVKLLVGPGNPGPADAPSTSPGIGIEIWLPAPGRWNERIHALGGGGWQGGAAGMAQHVASPYAAAVAFGEGAVSSTTDAGHGGMPKVAGVPGADGDFTLLPDGSINRTLWRDFSVRAIHEQALKTKALTRAFYGRPARYSYWDGSSTGGRQAHKLAQAHPGDFDGIIGNMPALHWTRFLTAMLYPHIVYRQDLGGEPLSTAQLDRVSRAAIAACDVVGGEHLGYIMEPARCRYDPTRDAAVLCRSDRGRDASAACVTWREARALNKIWYGATRDGSVPAPADDNGWDTPLDGKRLWYGTPRGTSLWNAFFTTMLHYPAGVANPEGPNFLGPDQVAAQLQDPRMGAANFENALGNGEDGWRTLSYAQLADAFVRGVELNETAFSGINTDEPNLEAFERRGGKLLGWHGINDEVIPVQGSMQYYDRVVREMGDLERVQSFYRMYMVPGVGHHSPNGTANPDASPPLFGSAQLYEMLVAWVEEGVAPGRVDLATPPGAATQRSQPACPYPARAVHVAGDPNLAASYECR